VPCLHPEALRVFGLRLSEKSLLYICAALLACSGGLRSLWPSVCGLLWGMLYSWPSMPFSRLRFPRIMRRLCRAYVLPFIQSDSTSPPPGAATLASADSATGRGGGRGGGDLNAFSNALRTHALPFHPSPASVQQVCEMGFSEGAAIAALRNSRGDVDAAVAALLGAN
jgi:hypothetical protein